MVVTVLDPTVHEPRPVTLGEIIELERREHAAHLAALAAAMANGN